MPSKRPATGIKKGSKALVIDASVARSAGLSEHPNSKACREFLQDVLTICHSIVMTPDLRKEWDKHRSNWSATWLGAMKSRKKLRSVAPSFPALRAKITAADLNDSERAALEKDLLLLEAALATDRSIASLDENARQLTRKASASARELRSLVWVNPTNPEEEACAWLHKGAKPEKHRTIRP